MPVTVSNVAERFDVSVSTIHHWTRRFAPFLSESATPAPGEVKQYTTGDLAVFALVATLTPQGVTYDEVEERLASGERVEPPEEDAGALHGITTDRELELGVQLATWQARYQDMAERVKDLEDERRLLSDTRGRNEELRTQLAKVEEELERVRHEKEEALERAVRAETERAMLSSGVASNEVEQPTAPTQRAWWQFWKR